MENKNEIVEVIGADGTRLAPCQVERAYSLLKFRKARPVVIQLIKRGGDKKDEAKK